MMPSVHSVHTESRTRLGDHMRQRYTKVVMDAAKYSNRLMPVVVENRIISWVGGSMNGGVYAIDHKPWMRSWIDRDGMLMGFPTVDSVIATTQNEKQRQLFWHKEFTSTLTATTWSHLWGIAGFPDAGVYGGSARAAVQHTDQDRGALMHGGNVSTDTKHILSAGVFDGGLATINDSAVYVPYDYVIGYDSCDVNSASQNFDNTLTAQRYISGSDGPAYGLQIMGAITSTTTAQNYTAANPKYTSITGSPPEGVSMVGPTLALTAGSTPTSGIPFLSSFSTLNNSNWTILNLPLRNGDQGVKQLDSYQFTSTAAGQTVSFILGFPLGWFPAQFGSMLFPYDCVKQLPASCARIRDGACLTIAMWSASAFDCPMGFFTAGWGT